MKCQGPAWILQIFEWLEENLITQEIVDTAMNWMLDKGILTCNNITI